jgi:hypothetical protein
MLHAQNEKIRDNIFVVSFLGWIKIFWDIEVICSLNFVKLRNFISTTPVLEFLNNLWGLGTE